MKFTYLALDSSNKLQKGTLEAANLRQATELLVSQGWFIKKIIPQGGGALGRFFQASFGGVGLVDKVLLVKHLATMIKSGITLHEALEVIADQTNSPKFKKIIGKVLERVKSGQSLGVALAKFPKVFDPLFINIIKIGEESGTLEQNLDYLGSELDSRLELRRKVKSAAFYPSIILLATFGLGLVLSYFVLPKITRLFNTLQFDLPVTTRILLATAHIIESYGTWLLAGLFILVVVFRILVTQRFFKAVWHWFLIQLPVLGPMIIHYNMVLINRTLSIMLKSGLTIDYAIKITAETTTNVIYRKRLLLALPQVQKGTTLSEVLSRFKQSKRRALFSLLTVKMISVGERSGRLDESFAYLADYFDKEVDAATKNLTTILEPILLVAVGLIVGFIAVSVIAPIYQVTGQFRR